MKISFEFVTALEYRLKAASKKILAFESGQKYIDMQEDFEKKERSYQQQIRQLQLELSKAHAETVSVRNKWFETCCDMEKEHKQEMAAAQKQIRQLEQRALKAEHQRDEALDKVTEQRHQIYELGTELEDEKGKNQILRAQISRDYENSSIPSSMKIGRKKITNNRERTGRKPGGQPGHTGHRRQRQIPTSEPVLLMASQEILDDPDFKKTSRTIVKQLINIRLVMEVTEYHAEVYYNSKTGERVHAPFPAGVVNDVNYGGSVKAFLFLLNNDCCVSIDKSRKFLSGLTEGKLNISKGMINKLSREFAQKTEQQQKELFADLLLSPVMHIDCTNARENGKSAYVFICATPEGKSLYVAREKKGHEGVKGTPAEEYQGILIHDHESTFYNYGSDHQECLAHVLRYLKDSIQNEPEREWNGKMRSLVQEMIHYRNSLAPGMSCDAEKVEEFETRYCEILQKAKEEYEDVPASEYYKEGYNLSVRMDKYMKNHLLFLHDQRVPATNNLSEQKLRSYKRKQAQTMTFRSFESIDYLCQCMSMLVLMRLDEETNIFDKVSQIFG